MKLFLTYIKHKRLTIAANICFFVIFTVVFALYGVPLGAVLYPSGLCALLGVFFVIYDFSKVRQKYEYLSKLRDFTQSQVCDLPDADTVEGLAYKDIIVSLQNEIKKLCDASDERYRNAIEYYTVWAHQIKIPLSAMYLTLQSEDTPQSRQLRHDLFRIEQYVDMVLTFLRLDSDSGDYVFKEYNIDTIIKQAVKKFSGEFIGRKIQLDYKPIERRIVTDEKWFSFVVEQIISNALKYTQKGSICIYLSEPCTLCIKDTGIGIAPEDLPRVFEYGYTGYNGRIDKKASGIGLYLCKRICKNLGTDIKIESEVGVGTTVRIDLSQYNLKPE